MSAIVKYYIATGEPMSSKLLAKETGMGLSSATLRNEMSELAEMGYLEQPHTSAGRVPTELGYRVYVDSLMEAYPLQPEEKAHMDRMLQFMGSDLEKIIEKSGEALASVTGCATVTIAPSDNGAQIRRIEMVPAGRRSLLVVLLTSAGLVKHRFYRVEDDLSSEMLSFFSQFVNENICGRELREITPALCRKMEGELYEYTFVLRPVLRGVFADIASFSDSEVFLGGEANLLARSELGLDQAADILHCFEHPEELAKLLHNVRGGVQVRIGSELGFPLMNRSSVIAAPYLVHGMAGGTIGIIGPIRMPYSRLMSHIEYFAKALSSLIRETFDDG